MAAMTRGSIRAGGRGRGRRSAAEAARTRERVLRGAERLFARRGYGETSLRDVAAAAGVQVFTVQHHFGSKRRLHAEILRRWEEQVEELVRRVIEGPGGPRERVERVIAELFDFFLAHRQRLALNARASLGDGARRRRTPAERGWLRFMRSSMTALGFEAAPDNLPLLLITIEGILHHHILATQSYRRLFGRDLGDPEMARAVKRHLARVILALIDTRTDTGADRDEPARGTDAKRR